MEKLLDRKKIREEKQEELERKEKWEKEWHEKQSKFEKVTMVAKRMWRETFGTKIEELKKNSPLLQKRIKQGIQKWAERTNTKIDDFFIICKNKIWELRYIGLIFMFLVLLITNFRNQYFRFSQDEFSQKLKLLNFYPKATSFKLDLAKHVFEYGNKEIALFLLSETEQDLAWLERIGLGSLVEKKIGKVRDYLQIPQKKEMYLMELMAELANTPYSWQRLYKKAEIEAELYKQKELEETLALIRWLNPKLENVEKEFE